MQAIPADRITHGLKWLGTIAGILGAILVAAHIDVSGYGYLLFLVGSGSWTVAGWLMREPSIWTLNAAFTAINCLGIWRWLF